MKYYLLLFAIASSSCSSRMSGQYNFPMTINTYDSNKEEVFADCNLYSAETRLSFTAPQKINYQANCGPINILCKSKTKTGEFGLLPNPEEEIEVNTILSTGAGIIFDRLVDSTTPFGMFVRYTNAFDNSTCLIPKEINIILD
jgi:hypothetical protein|tara:strand:+ start:126 stop:554 length:429 start_codon:yes stop_codon:yes gene_type:complete